MKQLFKNIKQNKAKTISVFVLTIIVAFAGTLGLFMSNNAGNRQDFQQNNNLQGQQFGDESTTNSNDESTTSSTAGVSVLSVSTTDDSSTTQNDSSATQSDNSQSMPPDMQNNKMGRNNNTSIILICVSFGVGAIALIVICVLNAKKRKGESKKQIICETVAIILVAGVIGSGVSLAVASPLSNSLTRVTMSQPSDTTDNADGNTPPQIPENFARNSENTDASDSETTSDSEETTDGKTIIGKDFENKDFTGKRNNETSSAKTYLLSFAECIGILFVISIIAGLFAAMATKIKDDDDDWEEMDYETAED